MEKKYVEEVLNERNGIVFSACISIVGTITMNLCISSSFFNGVKIVIES